MLLFSSGTFTVDGITVFPDHLDPNQFWYLPGPVGLATMPDSDEPQFLLIEYTPGAVSSGVSGMGFLNVTVALKLSDTAKEKIMGQIRTQFPDAQNPNLAPVSFDEGTVQIVALDMQGSGGTSPNLPPGAFEAVQHILGAVSPELFGDNNALFGLSLSADGVSILEAAFQNGMAPVGAIYTLKFTGARPAIDVKITADLKRMYQSFSVGLTAQAYFVSAGVDATFEKLRQDGTIKVEVINLTTDATNATKEQWALDLFKDSIMAQWFQPSLSPTTAAAADASSITLPPNNAGKPAAGASGAAAGSLGTNAAHAVATMGGPAITPQLGGAAPTLGTPKPVAGAAGAIPAIGAGTTPTMGAAAPAGGTAAATTPPPAGTPQTPTTPKTPAPPQGTTTATPAKTPPATKPIAAAAGTAAAASSAASPFGVALRLKFVSQDELKTVEIQYNRMDAEQRVYAPQGYFGLMINKIDRSKHFLKIDGSDPFFNQFSVTVNPPNDFAGIGLLTAHIGIDYGSSNSSAGIKHGDFLFDAGHKTQQIWKVYEGLIQSTQFNYAADYKFDPESGWQGELSTYTVPTVATDNRVVNLDPHDFLGFLQVVVSANRIDPTLVDRIEVALQYTAKSGWTTATTFIVNSTSAAQVWKLRLADKTDNTYTYSTTCFLKNGVTFKSGPISSTATAILVNDPFDSAIDLVFQPALDALTQLAIVELNYHDDANNYSFQTTFQIKAAVLTPTNIHIPIIDSQKVQYQYRVTTLNLSNQSSQGAYIATADPLVIVSAPS